MRGPGRLGARPWTSALACLVLVVVVGAAGWTAGSWRSGGRPPMAAAMASVPRDALAFSFTDWTDVKAALPRDASRPGALVLAASQRDLSSRSVLGDSAGTLRPVVGWDVTDLRWEAYAQSAESSVVVARLDDSVSMAAVERAMRKAGYRAKGGLWTADRSTLGSDVSDLLTTVSLHRRERLVVASDLASAVRQADRVVAGHSPSLAQDRPMARTAESLADGAAVFLQRGRLACTSTAVDDPEDQPAAQTAARRAGGLATYRAAGRALVDTGRSGFGGQRLQLAMTFADPGVAHAQQRVRTSLTTGPFIGRTGQVADTLRLRSATTHGATVRLDLAHDPATDAFMSGSGAILFATCPTS